MKRRLTGVQMAWLVSAVGLTAWFGTYGAIVSTLNWPGLTLILAGFAFIAHRTTTRLHPTRARKQVP